MPTSNKTPALSLNNWLGTDKPMRKWILQRINLILDSVIGGHLQDAVSHLSAADREKFDSPYLLESYAGTGDAEQHFTLPLRQNLCLCFIRPELSVSMWRRGITQNATPGLRLRA